MGRQVEEERKDLSDAELGDTGRVDGFDKKKFPKYVLTPGDPDRIHVMAQQWDSAEEFVLGRGHRAATGVYLCRVETRQATCTKKMLLVR